ncbi:MAG TPA: phosphoribosylformylglycinamidine synthase subunit PurQ [Ktedonobacterales bacterium]
MGGGLTAMKFGVLVFPGTWSDVDTMHALGPVLGNEAVSIWHQETDLQGCDALVLPGGFAHGDYLRVGAIARFSPVMGAVAEFAGRGGLVLGICNGFHILQEAGLLPGALLRNTSLEFRCQWANVRVENAATPFTNKARQGQVLRVPISHGVGNFFADEATLDELERTQRVLFRYVEPDGTESAAANPNGSRRNIAGVMNVAGNVAALMPHPERACEAMLGGEDGRYIFGSMVAALAARQPAPVRA